MTRRRITTTMPAAPRMIGRFSGFFVALSVSTLSAVTPLARFALLS